MTASAAAPGDRSSWRHGCCIAAAARALAIASSTAGTAVCQEAVRAAAGPVNAAGARAVPDAHAAAGRGRPPVVLLMQRICSSGRAAVRLGSGCQRHGRRRSCGRRHAVAEQSAHDRPVGRACRAAKLRKIGRRQAVRCARSVPGDPARHAPVHEHACQLPRQHRVWHHCAQVEGRDAEGPSHVAAPGLSRVRTPPQHGLQSGSRARSLVRDGISEPPPFQGARAAVAHYCCHSKAHARALFAHAPPRLACSVATLPDCTALCTNDSPSLPASFSARPRAAAMRCARRSTPLATLPSRAKPSQQAAPCRGGESCDSSLPPGCCSTDRAVAAVAGRPRPTAQNSTLCSRRARRRWLPAEAQGRLIAQRPRGTTADTRGAHLAAARSTSLHCTLPLLPSHSATVPSSAIQARSTTGLVAASLESSDSTAGDPTTKSCAPASGNGTRMAQQPRHT